MYDDPFEELIGDRSYRFLGDPHSVPNGPRRLVEPPDPSGNEYMFVDDLRTHSLPYGRGLDGGFDLRLDTDDHRVIEMIINAIPAPLYRHDGLSDAFRDYIEMALTLLSRGTLYLEIEFYRESDEPNSRPVAFRLEALSPELIQTAKFGKTFYWQPASDRNVEPDHWTRELLDPARLIAVALRRHLRRAVDGALRTVQIADQDLDVMQKFTLGKEGRGSGFDLQEYQRRSRDIVLRETREMGWSGRGLLTEGLLDPMKAWRAIRFARLVAKLRDVALDGLQEAIARAGHEIGFEATISLSGVLTQTDLDRLQNELGSGTTPMAELLNPSVRKA